MWEADGSFPMFPGLGAEGASQCNAFLWWPPFATAILIQAQEYAMRALDLAREQQLSDQEQNSIQDLLSLISAEDAHPVT